MLTDTECRVVSLVAYLVYSMSLPLTNRSFWSICFHPALSFRCCFRLLLAVLYLHNAERIKLTGSASASSHMDCLFNNLLSIRAYYKCSLYLVDPVHLKYCVTFAESEPYCHSILFVCLDVCRSFSDLQPTTIDRSQPNLVGRYILVLGPV